MTTTVRYLSQREALAWLEQHGYTAPYDVGFACRARLQTPRDSGKKSALVKSILTWVPSNGQCLLLLTNWGVWPSCENAELFERVRASIGPAEPIQESPGQLLTLTARGAIECLLDVCLFNYWDCVLAHETHRFLIRFSHDECVEICCDLELKPCVENTVSLFSRQAREHATE